MDKGRRAGGGDTHKLVAPPLAFRDGRVYGSTSCISAVSAVNVHVGIIVYFASTCWSSGGRFHRIPRFPTAFRQRHM